MAMEATLNKFLNTLSNDLTKVNPSSFVEELKNAYVDESGKAGVKFPSLRRAVARLLPTARDPGPARFVVHCVEAAQKIESPYNEGLSHLLIGAYSSFARDAQALLQEDVALSRATATALLMRTAKREIQIDARILVRLVVVFGVSAESLEEYDRMLFPHEEKASNAGTVGGTEPVLEGIVVNKQMEDGKLMAPLEGGTSEDMAGQISSPHVSQMPELVDGSEARGELQEVAMARHTGDALVAMNKQKEVVNEETGKAGRNGSDDAVKERSMAMSMLEDYIQGLILEKDFTSAVALTKGLGLKVEMPNLVMDKLVQDNRLEVAAAWAQHAGEEASKQVVLKAREKGQFKLAHMLVEKLGLESEFPDSHILKRQEKLRKMARYHQWQVAAELVEGEPQFEQYLMSLALEAGEVVIAKELADRFGISLPTEMEGMDEAVQVAREKYLKLSDFVEDSRVVWVDTAVELDSAYKQLSQADAVGLDSEWRAMFIKGKPDNSKVAILQLATRSHVFILDMLSLVHSEEAALDACLGSIFSSSSILKLGYGLKSDFDQLRSSYPQLKCFTNFRRTLDLMDLVRSRANITGGFSMLCKVVLGKPLCKAMQMTNWEMRPLTSRQIEYAALDALCLPLVYDVVTGRGQSQRERQVVTEAANPEVSMEGQGTGEDVQMQLLSLITTPAKAEKFAVDFQPGVPMDKRKQRSHKNVEANLLAKNGGQADFSFVPTVEQESGGVKVDSSELGKAPEEGEPKAVDCLPVIVTSSHVVS